MAIGGYTRSSAMLYALCAIICWTRAQRESCRINLLVKLLVARYSVETIKDAMISYRCPRGFRGGRWLSYGLGGVSVCLAIPDIGIWMGRLAVKDRIKFLHVGGMNIWDEEFAVNELASRVPSAT